MLSDIPHRTIEASVIKNIVKPRDPFTHKGDYGHACLLAGSIGMMGAAVLAVKACLRSGTGKVTVYIPGIGYEIMQISAPEAMAKIAGENFISSAIDIHKFDSLGIGPGLGLFESHKDLMQNVFSSFRNPIVIDADALNIIAENKDLLKVLPEGSILTPHKKEFERLFGKTDTDARRMELALEISHEYKIYVVLKGHQTSITTPEKKVWLNTTGNAGMATGGSGDVVTGILTGLLAQHYSCLDACLLGVYLHGLAGDIAAEKFSPQAMIAGDIIDNIGEAFKAISDK